MKLPNQAPPVSRAFMREVVGKRWASEGEPESASLGEPVRQKKRGRRSPPPKACLIELTTFAAPRSRGPFGRAA